MTSPGAGVERPGILSQIAHPFKPIPARRRGKHQVIRWHRLYVIASEAKQSPVPWIEIASSLRSSQ
jgi:hypothetical protein